MERYAIVSTKKLAILFLLILATFGLLGCTQAGRLVPADDRILFSENETGQGTFNTDGLTVDYTYKLQGRDLDLAGNAWYHGGVDSLNVYVLFIDPAGTVLQQRIAYYSGYRVSRHWAGDNSFQETLAVPPGAAGFSFSYSAQSKTIKR